MLLDCVELLSSAVYRVLSTGGRGWGGGGGGGGEDFPQTLQLPPKNFCQLNLTQSYNVIAKNLSVIPQLLGLQTVSKMMIDLSTHVRIGS